MSEKLETSVWLLGVLKKAKDGKDMPRMKEEVDAVGGLNSKRSNKWK